MNTGKRLKDWDAQIGDVFYYAAFCKGEDVTIISKDDDGNYRGIFDYDDETCDLVNEPYWHLVSRAKKTDEQKSWPQLGDRSIFISANTGEKRYATLVKAEKMTNPKISDPRVDVVWLFDDLDSYGGQEYNFSTSKNHFPIPKEEMETWAETPDSEKVKILTATTQGSTIQTKYLNGSWIDVTHPIWNDKYCYRIKPDMKTITIYSGNVSSEWGSNEDDDDTHKITFDVENGEVILGSVKMEKL